MSIKINFYGVLAEVTGSPEMELPNPGTTLALQKVLSSLYPSLQKYSYRFCIGRKLANDNESLAEGSSVSLLPPFSGG